MESNSELNVQDREAVCTTRLVHQHKAYVTLEFYVLGERSGTLLDLFLNVNCSLWFTIENRYFLFCAFLYRWFVPVISIYWNTDYPFIEWSMLSTWTMLSVISKNTISFDLWKADASDLTDSRESKLTYTEIGCCELCCSNRSSKKINLWIKTIEILRKTRMGC